ncbi:uncharacterized protein LOC124892750 [Capsicum annuum]|uniref:uncharacterized protein LOC124892750 n=1 Tax=Capsicum annuum TaxID=4072 RepID=UPI001FB12070|nr:uncharacterized protein LOC124892750 [Capsicum annuum]
MKNREDPYAKSRRSRRDELRSELADAPRPEQRLLTAEQQLTWLSSPATMGVLLVTAAADLGGDETDLEGGEEERSRPTLVRRRRREITTERRWWSVRVPGRRTVFACGDCFAGKRREG